LDKITAQTRVGGDLKLRKYLEGDRESLARVGVLAFGESLDEWADYFDPEKNPRLDPDQVHVAEEDGEARSSVVALSMESYVGGEPHSMGGIAAVMAHPAYRRRGYAKALMHEALRDMRERGIHLSMLDPFSHSFYRTFGYELAMETIGYKLKPSVLPISSEQQGIRAYREDDLPAMMRLLESEAAHYPMCAKRSEDYWRSEELWGKSDQKLEAAVFERAGDLEGYILYHQKTSSGATPPRIVKVEELVAATREARAGLLSFLASYNPDEFSIQLSTSRGMPLHPYLADSDVDARIQPGLMLRLVDVEGALRFKTFRGEPLVLDVSDDVLPENAGEYTIGNGEVVRGAEVEERVSLDVRQLAQLYAGYLPARELARHGLIESSSAEALSLLEIHFPVGDPWVSALDHF